jgi:hypothetical protein
MTKPFDLMELSARLNAVAHRCSGNPNPLVKIDTLQIDLAARTVAGGSRPVNLTAREWALFEAFVQHPGQALSALRWEATQSKPDGCRVPVNLPLTASPSASARNRNLFLAAIFAPARLPHARAAKREGCSDRCHGRRAGM